MCIVSSILIITLICFGLDFSIDDWSKIITTIVAIGGFMIAYSYNNGAKNQRKQQLLQNTRENYNKFIEAFMMYIFYMRGSAEEIENSKELIQYVEQYTIELARLSTYASQNVILYTFFLQNYFCICGNDKDLKDLPLFDNESSFNNTIDKLISKNTKEEHNDLSIFKLEKQIKEILKYIFNINENDFMTKNSIKIQINDNEINLNIKNIKSSNKYYLLKEANKLVSINILLYLIRTDLSYSDYINDAIVLPERILINNKIVNVKAPI